MSDPNWNPAPFVDTIPVDKSLWQPFADFEQDAEVPEGSDSVSGGELLLVAFIVVMLIAALVCAGWSN